MRLTKKRADNGKYYLSGLAEVSNSYHEGYGRIQVGHAVEKLAEYEDLEEQKKLLILPCAVGDTVYAIYSISESRHIVYDFEIDALHLVLNVMNEEFGKTVFLTKEAAEAALKEVSE